MSMILRLVTLSDTNIENLLRDPPLVWRVIAPDDLEPYEAAREQEGRSDPNPPDLFSASGEGYSEHLDKAWHGIHYLLTGTAWEGTMPLSFLLAGGREVGDIDVGYGPARVFTAAETKEIAAALATVHAPGLRARFDAHDMAVKDIYPSIWDRTAQDDDPLGYLVAYFGTLRGFLGQSVQDGLGFVVYTT